MHFGCDGSRNLDSYVHFPEDQAPFDEHFEQKVPLELKDKLFTKVLQTFIKMWRATYAKDLIKKPKGHKEVIHNRKI